LLKINGLFKSVRKLYFFKNTFGFSNPALELKILLKLKKGMLDFIYPGWIDKG